MGFRHVSQIRHLLLGASVAILSVVGEATADGLPSTVTVEACTTCHGPDGVSMGEMPTIAGQDANALAEALRGFRDGNRSGTIMGRLAGPLSDDEIAAISGYFAAKPGAGQ